LQLLHKIFIESVLVCPPPHAPRDNVIKFKGMLTLLLLELASESIAGVAQIAVPNGKELLALLRGNGILILDSTSITLA